MGIIDIKNYYVLIFSMLCIELYCQGPSKDEFENANQHNFTSTNTTGLKNAGGIKTDINKEEGASEYEKVLCEALSLQSKCDSISWNVNDLKDQAQSENNFQEKQQLLSNAALLENEAERIQNMASIKFSQAEKLRVPGNNENNSNGPLTIETNNKNDFKVIAYPEEIIEIKKPKNKSGEIHKASDHGRETTTNIAKPKINDGFRIMGSSPYSKRNPIPFHVKLPEGLVYRVQLGIYAGILEDNAFGGLTPISAEKVEDKDLIRYYAGYFNSMEEARKALTEVKLYGYPDAFLVSYFNKEKISVQKAKEIEFTEK